MLIISNHLPDYSLNCVPFSPITITNQKITRKIIIVDKKLLTFDFQTTLAHIIANSAGRSNKARFVPLSATTSGINDVKEVVKVAKNEQQMFKRKTILFVDEIHRFNKLQQVHLSLYRHRGNFLSGRVVNHLPKNSHKLPKFYEAVKKKGGSYDAPT